MVDAQPILEQCRDLGFAIAGVCAASPTSYEAELRTWLADGKHGEMSYLARNVELRCDPADIMPDVRSVICVADRYAAGAEDQPAAGAHGRIARYARGDDYHRSIKRRLHGLCDALALSHPDESFRACVDTAPVLEREHAQRAGVGAVGKHTLLIDRGVGSYLLLGEVLTTMEIAPSPASEPDPCGSCQRCIDACPTDAITPFAVDARRCISYLTIEHRSIIDEQFHAAIGDWLFGCDICQDVCPHNQATDRTTAAPVHDIYAPQRSGFDVLDVLGWTEDDRRLAFIRSALKRAKLGMMKRNALIVGANLLERMTPEERAQYAERVERLQCDVTEEDIVRETARQIAARL